MNTEGNSMDREEVFSFLDNMYKNILIDMNVDEISNYFIDDYVQVTDGVKSDLEEFKKHLFTLKNIVKTISISPFYDLLFDEKSNVATLRYIVHVEKRNGECGDVEVIALFELNNFKIVRCNELTTPLDSVSGLEDIGRVSS